MADGPRYFAGALVGSTAGAIAFYDFLVTFLCDFIFLVIVDPLDEVFDSIDEDDFSVVDEAGAGAAVGFGAAVWAKRPVGRAAAIARERTRARFLFMSRLLFGAAKWPLAFDEEECRKPGVNGG